jgi:prepilin-type N-terminal cleavage/methylation domain-containing protein
MNAHPAVSFRGRSRGFTLLEMMVTLAVFVLLSAAIFGIISGVLKSAASLQDNQNRADQVMALRTFMNRELTALPGGSLLMSYRRGNGEGLDQNGILFGTSGFLTAIDAKLQPNGLYNLRMATFSDDQKGQDPVTTFLNDINTDDASLSWRSLIRDVQHVDWKFQQLNNTEWADFWNNTTAKPNLVEFTFQIAGELKPSTMDFWIPPIVAPSTIVPTSTVSAGGTVAPNTPPTTVPATTHVLP